jgi:hypothetical protein
MVKLPAHVRGVGMVGNSVSELLCARLQSQRPATSRGCDLDENPIREETKEKGDWIVLEKWETRYSN